MRHCGLQNYYEDKKLIKKFLNKNLTKESLKKLLKIMICRESLTVEEQKALHINSSK